METQVYSHRMLPKESPLYSRVDSIKKIVYDSPLVQRIVFEKGEIELNLSGNLLNIFTKLYAPDGSSQVTRYVPKYIGGNDAKQMLNRAREDIVQRVTDLEMRNRDNEIDLEVLEYIRKQKEANEKRRRLEAMKSKYLTMVASQTSQKAA
ncbi:MAG: hypothetical protein AABX99_00435 [Nanoarchaeota archaeon]